MLPFALLAVGYFLARCLGSLKWGRGILAGYLALVLVASIPLYLMATGLGPKTPVLKEYLKGRLNQG